MRRLLEDRSGPAACQHIGTQHASENFGLLFNNQVADSCKAQGAPDCEVYPFDLVNTDDIDSLAKRILQDKQVDVLVNNAGIMVPGSAYEGGTCIMPWLLSGCVIIVWLQHLSGFKNGVPLYIIYTFWTSEQYVRLLICTNQLM